MFDDEDTVDELPAPPRIDILPADRELLELAARAIGATRTEEVDGEGYLNLHLADGTVVHAWNPLIHSDDALALATTLYIVIAPMQASPHEERPAFTAAYTYYYEARADVVHGDDANAATRRAVTMAAAQVGKDRE